ncbi:MAG: hypothetical protein JWP59_2985, partial [Massilia sp.]|nr:hypothetical protein [Massilia sp.]
MRGDPALVADAIDISKKTCRKIQQNLSGPSGFDAVPPPADTFLEQFADGGGYPLRL